MPAKTSLRTNAKHVQPTSLSTFLDGSFWGYFLVTDVTEISFIYFHINKSRCNINFSATCKQQIAELCTPWFVTAIRDNKPYFPAASVNYSGIQYMRSELRGGLLPVEVHWQWWMIIARTPCSILTYLELKSRPRGSLNAGMFTRHPLPHAQALKIESWVFLLG